MADGDNGMYLWVMWSTLFHGWNARYSLDGLLVFDIIWDILRVGKLKRPDQG